MPKEEYGAIDAAPAVLYGKKTDANGIAFPVLLDDDGNIGTVVQSVGTTLNTVVTSVGTIVSSKNLSALVNVDHDEKVFTWTAGNLTEIVYKKATVTVATVTLTWTAGDLTRMVVT